ncbi:hypothetical protein GCM10018781_41780 [Kitasatospora indigofera]|uniref:Uncharacterized protein n=1 Tax=Kitasatospora indigofera TaxID=67307 RepID=A0A919FY38_9ACTN|nr:hypothetical protein [Kitasatospora indigofera]GHH74662.1 hypothetical protein GCM10018781_41780 [Kitasatospora indigofera]
MSAAAVGQPFEPPTLLEAADLISDQLVGYRVEIIGSQIAVTPPANAPHSRSLTDIMVPSTRCTTPGRASNCRPPSARR